ncbi:MAG: Large cysteine-rich periplasmic protein omcB [Chlamydiales bacterium]|nr:Large cysteine-rich periplasmic protein omcB [Chlamydiales bacterium]MCH9619327.1 Large cysteine-rich periplasmic protein omcB [Chlamydiales bacterium]MCH9622131.1 Large cysteine-rich periplasmic protein omcB [Chlamydiales bacterium]
MSSYRTCDDCVVDLCQTAPEFATVGSPYPVEISITAKRECADVMVRQTLPCDSQFVKSDPPAKPDKDNSLSWSFPHLKCGETQKICVWIKPMKEGCCLAAATVCACPQLCAYTNCGQPVICIKKCGPESACLYCPVQYKIEVCNSGSATAYDVVVQDNVPDALCHESGQSCLTYELGNMCPGDKKMICLDFCAVKRGCVTNVATVSFCGGPKCSAEATTLINEPCVNVTKTGPDWAYICKPVEYTITVTNPGDLVLNDVIVDDVSPIGTTIVDAPGAEICCNRALWCLPQLCPGETKTFNVTVRSQMAGSLTNKVTVTTNSECGQCTSCAEATTCWKGMAATHMCMVETNDPVCVGETTVYRICVSNRGSADDKDAKLVVKFTDELQPISSSGPTTGNIVGNRVEFEPIETLYMNQSVEYCITVKAVSSGGARGEATISSEGLSSPVTVNESTQVY